MSAPGKLVRSSRWKSGPSKGQRPLGASVAWPLATAVAKHGIDAEGKGVIRRQLKAPWLNPTPPCNRCVREKPTLQYRDRLS